MGEVTKVKSRVGFIMGLGVGFIKGLGVTLGDSLSKTALGSRARNSDCTSPMLRLLIFHLDIFC